MISPKVKICGITNPVDARLAADAGADALGFIFYQRSPRYINPKKAAAIIRTLPPYVCAVGIFVNDTRKRIRNIIDETGIRIIQLSGDELPEDCSGYPGVKVWKGFRPHPASPVDSPARYSSIAAALIDGASGSLYGGSGVMADLTVAKEMKRFHPVVVAGGLTPENIVDVIRNVEPYAVDVNSGVEQRPGRKDPEKIQKLFSNIQFHLHEKGSPC